MKIYKIELKTPEIAQSFHVEASSAHFAKSIGRLFARQHFGVAIHRHRNVTIKAFPVDTATSNLLEAQQVHALLNLPQPVSKVEVTDNQPDWAEFCNAFQALEAAL